MTQGEGVSKHRPSEYHMAQGGLSPFEVFLRYSNVTIE